MDQNIWKQVLEKTDIINIIGEFLPLQKNGKNFRACCPFHGEKTPSFIVSPEKQIFTCFGCGKTGNALKFLELYKNISAIDALEILAKKVNINIDQYKQSRTNLPVFDENQLMLLEINKEANNFFQYHLLINHNDELIQFMKKRNLTKEIVKEFEIGYASEEKSIYQFLKERNFSDQFLINSSLVSKNNIERNFFIKRLMFPIKNENGNIVAFSGRDITGFSETKYLNSAETIVFSKNKTLFNFFKAKNAITSQKEVYLVEGQFDCIALHKANITNTVALMGTHFSEYHLNLLKNCKINLFLDSDNAGKKATLKNLKIILFFANKYNLKVNFVINLLNKDPDELFNIDNGKTLIKVANNKIDLNEFLYLNYFQNQPKNLLDEQKTIIYREMFEYLFYLDDQLKLIFKQKVIENGFLNIESYDSFYKQYCKPNFPSDFNFKRIVQNSQSKTNKEIIKANSINNDIKINKNSNNKRQSIINCFGRTADFYMILKSILKQPSLINKFETNTFSSFVNYNQKHLEIRLLISYVVDLIKTKKYDGNYNNLTEIITNDSNLSEMHKQSHLKTLATLTDLNVLKDLEQDEFNNKIKEITTEKPSNIKKLLKH
ncbi:DNA primase [[Mycoplasma] anseris]|uniref:DNA primase n=1 Tax=[Mycoplasma] anseris TaxID=92400 RepID=A0A2Z4NCB2_9BACT|nr:DNA primase [[Mycoplasma] anseris]AWX69201.1 DNA primase [[Mycoplasma] anseris]